MIVYAALIAVLYAGSCMGQFGLAAAGAGGGCKIDPKCYFPCPDYTLAGAFPFVRQTPISCEACQSLCNKLQIPSLQTGGYVCQAAVYDATVGSCDIFAVGDQTSGFGFGRRKRDGGAKVPHKQRYPGRLYLQPTGFCKGQGGNDTAAGGVSASTTASPSGGGGATTAATTSGGAAATTTAATSTTSGNSVLRKKAKDQAPLRRRDDVPSSTRCIAHRTAGANGRRDCSTGVRLVNGHRQLCTPTAAECLAS